MYKQHTTPLPQICRAAILSFLFLGVGTGLAKADTVSLGSVNAAYKYDSAELIAAQKECYKDGNPAEVSSPATYRIPFDGVLTAFSFSQRSTKASKMKIKVLRPDGMMKFLYQSSSQGSILTDVPAHKVVQVSDVLPINPISGPAGRFAITSGSLRIPVQQNDFIAMQTLDPNLTCLQPSIEQNHSYVNGDHSVGERFTIHANPNPFELPFLHLKPNLRVNIESDLNHNGYGDDSQEPPVDPTLVDPTLVDPTPSPQEQNVQNQNPGIASPSAQVTEVGAANQESQPSGAPNQSSTGPRTATAKVCRVPKVRGLKLSVAKRRLKRAGCRIAKVQASKKKQTTRRVKSTLPKAGQKTTKPVKIILAKR